MRERRLSRALCLAALFVASACAPRARMCTATPECGDKSACVAGRCQLEKPTVKPAVDSARRLVLRPVDLAYVKRGDGPSGGGLPPLAPLGKSGGRLFLRFSAPLAPTTTIVEAYVVLRRATVVDDDPQPINLHAARIAEAWTGASVSWPMQPRCVETRSPSTTVAPAGSPLVRVDVRDLVRQWPRHDPLDQGIAVVAESESETGISFALDAEPYLEVYVR